MNVRGVKKICVCSKSEKVDGYEWRCRNQSKDNRHDVVRSVRKETWFSESKLAITIILRLTRYWILPPIENVWDALGRQVAGRNYPPTNKNTLIRVLTEEWDKLPQQLLDNVVQRALVASTWSTKITDSEDSDAENELLDTLP
ncbi:hypothetical protein TNCV_790051 [Trichonephila clavipes]|nr:hypothetical protein TNCV_790051 [Trichonephila clavipes]